jgi:hypothetical protein
MIRPPAISKYPRGGWEIDCWTLYGWMHLTTSVTQCRFAVSPDYAVASHCDEACSQVFESAPWINY